MTHRPSPSPAYRRAAPARWFQFVPRLQGQAEFQVALGDRQVASEVRWVMLLRSLRLAPGDGVGVESRWDWYPLELVTSAGFHEFSTLPDTVGELARRAGQRDRLRV